MSVNRTFNTRWRIQSIVVSVALLLVVIVLLKHHSTKSDESAPLKEKALKSDSEAIQDLENEPKTYALAGVLLDPFSQGAQGADITFQSQLIGISTQPQTQTDDQGRFRVALPQNQYQVHAKHSIWGSLSTSVKLEGNPEHETSVVLRYLPAAQVIGSAYRSSLTSTVFGVEVLPHGFLLPDDPLIYIEPESLSSEQKADSFTIAKLVPGLYMLRFHNATHTVEEEVTIFNNYDRVSMDIEFDLRCLPRSPLRMAGKMLSGGDPLRDQEVRWRIEPIKPSQLHRIHSESTLTTNREGSFALEHDLILPGITKISFAAAGVEDAIIDFTELEDVESCVIEFESEIAKEVTAFDCNGVPLAHVRMMFNDSPKRVVTDADGAFSLPPRATMVTARIPVRFAMANFPLAPLAHHAYIAKRSTATNDIECFEIDGSGAVLEVLGESDTGYNLLVAVEDSGPQVPRLLQHSISQGSGYIGSFPESGRIMALAIPRGTKHATHFSTLSCELVSQSGLISLEEIQWTGISVVNQEGSAVSGAWVQVSDLGLFSDLEADQIVRDRHHSPGVELAKHLYYESDVPGIYRCAQIPSLKAVVLSQQGVGHIDFSKAAPHEVVISSSDFVAGQLSYPERRSLTKILAYSFAKLKATSGEFVALPTLDGKFCFNAPNLRLPAELILVTGKKETRLVSLTESFNTFTFSDDLADQLVKAADEAAASL